MPTWKKLAYQDDVITKALLTEQGDIIYASGVATPAALAHGLVTQYLKSGGHAANPSWDTPAGGGATLTVAETEVFNGAGPTIWTDLNLAGIIGANPALLLLKVQQTYNTTARYIAVRKNGDGDEFYPGTWADTFGMATAKVVGQGAHCVLMVAADANGVIEWKVDYGGLITWTIDIIAYIK